MTEEQTFKHKADLCAAIAVKLIDEINESMKTGRTRSYLDSDMVDVIWDELNAEIIPSILGNPFLPNDYLPDHLIFKVDVVNLDFSISNTHAPEHGSLPYMIFYNEERGAYTLTEYVYEPE